MKLVVATESSTLMRWCRASLLASPTVLPASMVPWRWIAPVRARIASKSVVLPLWNGPTSATQRGPVALVPLPPFVAMVISHGCRLFQRGRRKPIVSGVGGAGQEVRHCARGRAPPHGNLLGEMQLQRAYAGRDIEPGLALHRKRLQRHRTVRAADQHVGAEPGRDRHLRGRVDVGPGKHAGIEIGAGKHAPDDGAAAGYADVETDAGQCSDIGLGWSAPRLEIASHIACRRDDEADAGRQRAFERATLHTVLLRAGRHSQHRRERCSAQDCANGIAKHMESPLTRPAWRAIRYDCKREKCRRLPSIRVIANGRKTNGRTDQAYCKFPQKRWMRVQASSSALVAVA